MALRQRTGNFGTSATDWQLWKLWHFGNGLETLALRQRTGNYGTSAMD
eukprot:CAMPEP_0203744598 /NCGR_PEP_ID=MMETSP0098-20131031/620_1 /ASSEMBLY_ACC=CAM_ASM_000208 /TAXON_ID=96639 /ORGANISM=" , Strain NY0313808BC1" /LENGTH=47 /DNA_ID= /DNA_START= /DNA_END= /DNA_ORIENTATION=